MTKYHVEGMNGGVVPYHDQIKILSEIDDIVDTHRLGEDYHITFVFTKRLTKAAGNCTVSGHHRNLRSCRIALSTHYYKQFGVERTIGTIRHELAHLMDYLMTGKMSHGANFKRICVQLGGTMNTAMAGTTYAASGTNEYLDKTARNFKYVYTCTCGSKIERKIRMKRGLRLNHNKICVKCKTPLPMWKETKVAI